MSLALPPSLFSREDTTVLSSSLSGKITALFFASSSSKPCQILAPKLAAIYTELEKAEKPFEVILVSADADKATYDAFRKTLPFPALRYEEKGVRESLEKQFDAAVVPSLVLFDEQGKLITTKGKEAVFVGGAKAYPYKPSAPAPASGVGGEAKAEKVEGKENRFSQLLGSASRSFLVDNKENKTEASSLKGKVVALYFSGAWCGFCKVFTPKLSSVHRELRASNRPFEVVFISADRNQQAFQDYFATMPWLALPFEDREAAAALGNQFQVAGYPTLVLLDEQGELITADGRGAIEGKGARGYPWKPDPAELARKRQLQERKQLEWQGELETVFRHIDADGDGRVTNAELVRRLRAGNVCPGAQVDQLSVQIFNDVNPEDKTFISLFEWLAYFQKVLTDNQKGEYWSLDWLRSLLGIRAPNAGRVGGGGFGGAMPRFADEDGDDDQDVD